MKKEPDLDCEFCAGRGTVRFPVYDEDSHKYQDIGERQCVCTMDIKEEPDYSPDDLIEQ